ncbi:DMT family transporter [Tabrizicola piscis]|uniref:DMT family transporter n=1 Tax=Tabrizicola piscis TaxID=2494374 RepID=A0A3S8U507_9RHOB|nr:DMT family transporter [Tabrizicola piscis]
MRYGQGVALVLAAGSLWSLMGLGLRQIEAASVWQILFWRSVGMVPVLFAFIWWRSGGRPFAAIRKVGLAGVIGGCGLVFAFAGAIYAIQTTTIANAVFLFTASPFVAAILGWIILGERVGRWTWVAIGLAVIGMYLMVREGLAMGELAGNIAALLSAVGFGAFSVALRWGKVGQMLPVSMLGGVFSVLVAGLVLTASGEPIVVSGWDIGVSLGIGAVILALGMVMYTLGSKVIPAAELTLLSLIEVLLAPMWVFAFLGETASAATFVGGGVLLAAVVLNAVMGARAQMAQTLPDGGLANRARPVNE